MAILDMFISSGAEARCLVIDYRVSTMHVDGEAILKPDLTVYEDAAI